VTFAASRDILLFGKDLAVKFHKYKTLWEETQTWLPRRVTEHTFYATALAGGVRTGSGLALRLGIPQGDRPVLDAGHVCQNVYWACEAVRTDTCAVAA
jgi:hypothetical protein